MIELISLLKAGRANDVFINIDAEHYQVRDLTLYVYGRARTS